MTAKQEFAQSVLVRADRALVNQDYAAALAHYNEVFQMGLGSWSMHVNAAQCHKRLRDLESAFRHFDQAFLLKRQPTAWAGAIPPKIQGAPNEAVSVVFLANLQEQLQFLREGGNAEWYDDGVRDELEAHSRLLAAAYGAIGAGTLGSASKWVEALSRSAPYRPEFPEGDALLSDDLRIEEVPLYGGTGDRFYIIDNLFNAAALKTLLDQLLESTIWFDARAQRSYLGAHLHDGLATPFMLSVAVTLRDLIEKLVGEVIVAQLWAFRYLANSKGIDIHADQGDWNFNLWPVHEENMSDSGDQGGMTIYDLRIADDIPFAQYNSQPELNRSRIERANAHAHVVPYRGNRAVVFPSKYLHKTNAASFADKFTGRRINVTLMADKVSSPF